MNNAQYFTINIVRYAYSSLGCSRLNYIRCTVIVRTYFNLENAFLFNLIFFLRNVVYFELFLFQYILQDHNYGAPPPAIKSEHRTNGAVDCFKSPASPSKCKY